MGSIGDFPTHLPKLDKNWEQWNVQKKTLFTFQEVIEIIKIGYSELDGEATEIQKTMYNDCKEKDGKALFTIARRRVGNT